jgi:hypothetical protein
MTSLLPLTVRQVDHLMVRVPDPARTHRLCTGTLGLPVAWPLADYGEFVTGGISLGNVNVEFLNSPPAPAGEEGIPDRYGIVGVAFHPEFPLTDIVEELNSRGIFHGPLLPFAPDTGGGKMLLWTELVLTGIMPGTMVFYCEYHFNQAGFHRRMEAALAEAKGGPLGVTGLKEITVCYQNPEVPGKWRKILAGAPGADPEALDGGNGLRLRLVRSDREMVSSMTIGVNSPDEAAAALEAGGVPCSYENDTVTLGPDVVPGARIVCEK